MHGFCYVLSYCALTRRTIPLKKHHPSYRKNGYKLSQSSYYYKIFKKSHLPTSDLFPNSSNPSVRKLEAATPHIGLVHHCPEACVDVKRVRKSRMLCVMMQLFIVGVGGYVYVYFLHRRTESLVVPLSMERHSPGCYRFYPLGRYAISGACHVITWHDYEPDSSHSVAYPKSP